MDEPKTADIAPQKGVRYGGRAPGTPNKVTIATRVRIEAEADPIGFLGAVSRSRRLPSRKAASPGKRRKQIHRKQWLID